MAMQKAHSSIPWVNYPEIDTPLNAQNLLKEDTAIDVIDDRVISLDTTKFDKTEAQGLFKDVELDPKTGIITFTTYSGAKKTIDTLLEKIAINFDFDEETQKIIINLEDGTTKEVDLKSFITEYEFLDSETIAFTVDTAGKVTAIVKEGSIQEKHLRPDYLADIRVESAKAEAARAAAQLSETNAKNSENAAAESASKSADSAEEAAGSATSAAVSATTATEKATNASNSADAAKDSEEKAAESASNAQISADTATGQATSASSSASTATAQADIATKKAKEASDYATKAQSYTEGGTGTRENEETDNAKNYYEESKKIYDNFVSTGPVTGVKGSAETDYRHGNVNLTPANLGIAVVNNTLDANKRVSYATSSGSASILSVQADNYKDANALPSTYPRGETVFFSNNPTNKFNGIPYCTVHTIKGYSNMACIQFIYPYNTNVDIVFYRTAVYNSDVWRTWQTIATTAQIPTSLPANGGNATTATTASKVANALTFTGGVSTTYDGSVARSVAIPTTLPANGGNANTVGGKTVDDLQNYNNLTNKPTIPAAANNGTLTIQRNGSTVATFTANSSTNVTANIQDTDTNTDVNVTQTATTANANYPILLSSTTTTGTRGALFDSGVTLNPSTNVIAANVSGSSTSCTGNAATATTATKWNGYSLWFGTEAQYNAIATKDSKTIYFRS